MNHLNQSRSIIQKLINLSQIKNVHFYNMETDFIIERLLVRITADKKLNSNLIFKGGYVGLRVYHSARYTVDLDALLKNANVKETIEKVKECAAKDLGDCTWFEFEKEFDLKTQGEYGGIRIVFRAGIGDRPKDIKRARVIHFDLGIGDPVTPGPIRFKTPELLSSNTISWQVYPIETILAEKLHALITRGADNSRSKDIYDISQFLQEANGDILYQALEACFSYRETKLPENLIQELASIDLTLMKRGWDNAVASIKTSPSCEDCFELILILLSSILYESKILLNRDDFSQTQLIANAPVSNNKRLKKAIKEAY
jgi:predicted nucleotidyltransferase component of viral defense system